VSARTFSLEEVTRFSGGRNDASRLAGNFAGVVTNDDSRNDIVIRGNSPTGVLWRLEGVPIPNPNHFSTLGTTGGPVSALNTNLLKNSDFLTSAFPAEYGNALSGVFDVGFRSGNKDKYEFTAQLAAFSGLEAMVEGPISKKNNSSFLLSYRYSFVQLASTAGLSFGTAAIPKYQDLTYNFDLGKSKLGNFKFFGIIGRSDIEFKGKELTDNDLFANKDEDSRATSYVDLHGVKHSLILNKKSHLRTTLAYSRAGNDFFANRYIDKDYTKFITYTDVSDMTNRISLSSSLNTKHSAKWSSRLGVVVDYRILENQTSDREGQPDKNGDGFEDLTLLRSIDENYTVYEPFATLNGRITEKFEVVLGVHGLIAQLNTNALVEPRLGLVYKTSSKSSINLGYGLHGQTQPLPVLFLSSQNPITGISQRTNIDLGFTKAHHFVLGANFLPWKDWRIKPEVYYQYLFDAPVENQKSSFSVLNVGADFAFPSVGNLVNEGLGRNYGVELTAEKFFSKGYYALITGSVFESKYQGSDNIWRNTAFNNQYTINILAGKEWQMSRKYTLTTDIKFTNAGGRFVTPVDLYKSQIAKREIRVEDKAFSEKLTDYTRLDFKLGVRLNASKFNQVFFLDFQNVTNNQNIFARTYDRVTNQIKTSYQIGFFPDLLWRIQF
jgi:hypothetical protein